MPLMSRQPDPGRAARRQHGRSYAEHPRRLRVRGADRQLARRRASRSASSAPSRRGTTRSTRSSPRSRPALAAGCTVVLKPSEVAPLNAFILAEIIDEVGLPAGVFNLVTGTGPVVGEAIAAHPDVDMVSFTGSTRAGKRVTELGAADGQAGRARARRQVGQHHPRRRRPRRAASPPGVVRLLPQLGPDLLGAHPHARAPRRSRTRSSSIAAAAAESVHRRRPGRRRRPPRPAHLRRPSATACAATSRRASTRAPRSSPAAPRRPRVSTRATS